MTQRDEIAGHVDDAFKDHVLEVKGATSEGAPYVWRCGRPDTGMFAFWVMIGPGCIVQWGDVGGLMIARGPSYGLAWLRGAIHSMSYVLEKTSARKTEYSAELFLAVLEDYRKDREEPFEFELHYGGAVEDWHAFVEQTGAYEHTVHDYDGDTLWGYYALKKFCELCPTT